MKQKACAAQFKALDEEKGTFEAIVSVFGNVDLIGDRVVKGAFAKSLEQWKSSGDPIPVIWSHMWSLPAAHIGKTLSAEETDEGLLIKAQLDLDHPFSEKVYKLLKERRVKEFSFAYEVEEEEFQKDEKVNDLKVLHLIEVGPTLKGMNPDTQLMTVKGAVMTDDDLVAAVEGSLAKAGRVLSSKNEDDLKQARDLITNVLKQLEKPEEPKSTPQEPPRAIERTKDHLTLLLELEELQAS